MLYSPYLAEKFEGEDHDFFELVLGAIRDDDNELLSEYQASDLYPLTKFNKMCDEAHRIIEYERKGESSNSFEVKETYPAIEIENLCKNFTYFGPDKKDSETIPFGFLVFWIFIIPIVIDVAQLIGCEYIYIYAADQTENTKDATWATEEHFSNMENDDSDQFALISHYRTNFRFHEPEDLCFIRPQYDKQCHEMVQSVKEAIENSDKIWEQFEDILEKTVDIKELIP